MENGWILYVLFLVLMFVFRSHAGGRKMETLFEESHRHHQQVLGVIGAHPLGGTWKQHQTWMENKKKN